LNALCLSGLPDAINNRIRIFAIILLPTRFSKKDAIRATNEMSEYEKVLELVKKLTVDQQFQLLHDILNIIHAEIVQSRSAEKATSEISQES
jgi:hypothetical protein